VSYFGPEDLSELQGTFADAEAVQRVVAVFDRVLLRVHMKAIEDALIHIPEVVVNLIRYQRSFEFVKEAFMKANPDMADNVDRILAEIPIYESNNPGRNPEEILALIAKDIRHEVRVGTLATKIAGQTENIKRPSRDELASAIRGFDDETTS